jgi:DNA-3-methyladenine glycosylase
MVNVVTGPIHIPHAILIRAIEPLEGLEVMQHRRQCKHNNHLLTGGPGKVCQALGITVIDDDGVLLFKQNTSIAIFEGIDLSEIKAGPRVGMSHLTGKSAHLPWRFYVAGNKWVSRPLEVKYDY